MRGGASCVAIARNCPSLTRPASASCCESLTACPRRGRRLQTQLNSIDPPASSMSTQGGLAEDDADADDTGIFRINKFSRNYHRVDPRGIMRTSDLTFSVGSQAQANAMQFDKNINQWPVDWTKEGCIGPDHLEVYNDNEGSPAAYIIFDFSKVPFAPDEEKYPEYHDSVHGIRLSKDVAGKILEKWMKPTCPYLKKPSDDDKAPREPRNKYKLVYEALKKCAETANAKDAGWPVYTNTVHSRRVWPTSQRSSTAAKPGDGGPLGFTTEQGEAFALPRGVAKVTQIDYDPDEFAVQVIQGKRSLVVCQYRVEVPSKRSFTDHGDGE